MLDALRPVRSLLLSIFLLMAGGGFMSTLVSLRLEATGAGPLQIGLLGTAYFTGLTAGPLRATGLIRRVVHLRAFAAYVSLLSACLLSYRLPQGAILWSRLLFVHGI